MKSIKEKSYWRNFYFLDKYFVSQVKNNRKKFLKIFRKTVFYNKESTLLDVGTTPSLDEHENYLIRKFPYKKSITCLSNFDCKILTTKFPQLKCVVGDGCAMSIKNNLFDIVHSNATIEHVGSYKNQVNFIRECVRVSKKYTFITTPNRFFPMDFHSKIPLINLLPKNIFRKILKLFGDNFFSKEENLNLLSKNEIKMMLNELQINNFKIIENRFLGLVSNFLLVVIK